MPDLSPQRLSDTPGDPRMNAATRDLVRTFQRVTTSLYASSHVHETLQVIADGVIQLVGFRSAVVGIAVGDGGFEYIAFNGPREVRDAMRGAKMPREQWEWRLEHSVRWGSLCWIDHRVSWPGSMTAWIPRHDMVGAKPGDADAWDPHDFLFAPLRGRNGETLGVLSVDLPLDGRKPDAAQLELLELFAESAALALWQSMLRSELHEQHRRSEHMATHDPLTGLANRTALNATATRLLEASAGPVGALVVDLDRFKDINDEFGHAAGDEVLVVVAQRMARTLRSDDVLARTGGDEFVAVLASPDCCLQLNRLVERLHKAITSPIKGEAGIYRIGASIGQATMHSPTTLSELLQAADADMYRLKHMHRETTDYRLRIAT